MVRLSSDESHKMTRYLIPHLIPICQIEISFYSFFFFLQTYLKVTLIMTSFSSTRLTRDSVIDKFYKKDCLF